MFSEDDEREDILVYMQQSEELEDDAKNILLESDLNIDDNLGYDDYLKSFNQQCKQKKRKSIMISDWFDNQKLQDGEFIEEDDEGIQILKEQPRVNGKVLNCEELIQMPQNTLGFAYAKFMLGHGFKSDDRPVSKYIPDYELAYIFQRYKEIHDFFHVLLGYDTTVTDEILVKWFEMIQLGLPSAALSSLIAPLKLSYEKRQIMMKYHLPQMITNANNCKFVMSLFYEKRLEQDLNDLRKEIGIRVNPLRTLI